MNLNTKDNQRHGHGHGRMNQSRQDPDHRYGRGSQIGSGDAGEQQDQEEFDRGGQRQGQHSDTDGSQHAS